MNGTRSVWSPARRAILICLALALVIALMQVPWLNPTSMPGSRFGALMIVMWCAGLAIWVLGVVRRHRSQFRIRTLVVMIAVAALYFGSWRVLGPAGSTLLTAAAASVGMLYTSHAGAEGAISPFRNMACRAVMTAGALLMLAHVCRLFGYAALIALGVLERPKPWA